MLQKSYDNSPSLYLVPTPIGNLNDITVRAKEILSSVSAVFAEDTRVTTELLNALGIKNKVFMCHKFTEAKSSGQIINMLKEGKNVALVTDRGTPLISDPGALVVKNIVKEGFNVVALPGACAFIPALNMSGFDQDKFIFYGFLDQKESKALSELSLIKTFNYTTILYESPHRLNKTLRNMLKILGNKNISISREITKLHEEVFRGTIEEAIETYKDVKGEIVIVIEKNDEEIDYDVLLDEVLELVSLGLKQNDALKFVSKKYNASKNMLYNMLEEKKK